MHVLEIEQDSDAQRQYILEPAGGIKFSGWRMSSFLSTSVIIPNDRALWVMGLRDQIAHSWNYITGHCGRNVNWHFSTLALQTRAKRSAHVPVNANDYCMSPLVHLIPAKIIGLCCMWSWASILCLLYHFLVVLISKYGISQYKN